MRRWRSKEKKKTKVRVIWCSFSNSFLQRTTSYSLSDFRHWMWLCVLFFPPFSFTNCVYVRSGNSYSISLSKCCKVVHWFCNATNNRQHFPIEKFVFLHIIIWTNLKWKGSTGFAVLLPNDGLHLSARLQRSSHSGAALHEHQNHPHIATSCGWRHAERRGNG